MSGDGRWLRPRRMPEGNINVLGYFHGFARDRISQQGNNSMSNIIRLVVQGLVLEYRHEPF